MSPSFDASRSGSQSAGSSSLYALALVARRLGVDISQAELARSYAMGDSEPKSGMLIAMAKDLGLEAKIIRVKFKDLPRLGGSLPAIIRVTAGASLILEAARVDPTAGPIAILRDPTV